MNKVWIGRPEPSSLVSQHKGWLALWDTSAPNKAKVHVLRLMRNVLAIGDEIHQRRIKVVVFCMACNGEETIYQMFWSCAYSTLFWKVMRLEKGVSMAIPPAAVGSQGALCNGMPEWFAKASEEEKATRVHASYGLWLASSGRGTCNVEGGGRCHPPSRSIFTEGEK